MGHEEAGVLLAERPEIRPFRQRVPEYGVVLLLGALLIGGIGIAIVKGAALLASDDLDGRGVDELASAVGERHREEPGEGLLADVVLYALDGLVDLFLALRIEDPDYHEVGYGGVYGEEAFPRAPDRALDGVELDDAHGPFGGEIGDEIGVFAPFPDLKAILVPLPVPPPRLELHLAAEVDVLHGGVAVVDYPVGGAE